MSYFHKATEEHINHYEHQLLVCSKYYHHYTVNQLLEWYAFDILCKIKYLEEQRNEEK